MRQNTISDQQLNGVKQEDMISISQILSVINRRKMIIIISITVCLFLSLVYNYLSTPVYESYVIVKKEEKSNSRDVNEIKTMFSMRTTDDLNTEIEIVKSGTVLQRVINELKLTFFINEVILQDESYEDIYTSYQEYTNILNSKTAIAKKLPRFHVITVDYEFSGGNLLIYRFSQDEFQLFDLKKNMLIGTYAVSDTVSINLPGLKIDFSWTNSNIGDNMSISLKNIEQAIKNLKNKITITRVGETNLAKLSVESTSPKMAQILANTVIDKYRNFRLENKRENVLSSFQFVNNQLEDIKSKLEDAENALSQYKRDNKIAMIDESSKDVIKFLSNLENEKIKVDLELGDYRNKRTEMSRELEEKGYFDQTHLTPSSSDGRGTPFSTLMEQLSDLEIKRLELSQRRTETHPEVITITEQISQIKSKLAEYNKNTLTSYNIIINTLTKKRADLNRLIDRYSKKIENLPEKNARLIQLTRTKTVYEKMFTLLLDKREEFRLAELSKMQDIVIIEAAKIPHLPIRPKKKVNIIIGSIIGIFIGLITVFVKEVVEKRITSLDDIEKIHPLPLLTIIPKYERNLLKRIDSAERYSGRLVTLMEDQSIFKESYRVLDLKIRNSLQDNVKTLIITSCEENTGKTTVAINFAVSLALRNKHVLLIDGDLRKANVGKNFNISHTQPGLINYIADNVDASYVINSLIIDKKNNRTLDIIAAGGTTENSSEILESDRMNDLIEELAPDYDIILIDTPPLTRIIDTLILCRIIKDLILVIKPYHTYKDSIEIALQELEQSNVSVSGYVMNAGDASKLSTKYKYGYGYGYGYPVKKVKSMI